MNMPIKRFWLLNQNINRISAERDMRALTVAAVAAAGDKKQIEEYRQKLIDEIGTVVVADEPRDEKGVALLKAMALGLA